MCLVAFQKIFRKIFSGVWKRRRKTQIQKKSSTISRSTATATARSRDRRFARSRRRSRSREDSDLAFTRSRRRSRSRIAIDGAVVGLDLGCGLCFSGFVFSFFFSKHQKIFSGKFFEMQPKTWKHFPFPEISISGKYVFSGKRFTATKHSLNY